MKNLDDKTKKVFEELEKTSKDFWNISPLTGRFLNFLIKTHNFKNVVEVGTSNGYSGIWIGKALKETKGQLTTIEFWEKRIVLAEANFKECGVDDVITIQQGSALDVLSSMTEQIDFAFIDANKSEYVKYYEIIDKLLRKGGIITADNVLSHYKKTEPFIQAIKNNPRYKSEIINLPAGLLIAKKL